MNKILITIIVIAVVLLGGWYFFGNPLEENGENSNSLDMKTWTWVKTIYNNDTELVPNDPEAFTIAFIDDNTFSATTDCNSMSGSYEADESQIEFGAVASTRMFCEGSQENEFSAMLAEIQSYFFTNDGELILEIKFDSGSAIFK